MNWTPDQLSKATSRPQRPPAATTGAAATAGCAAPRSAGRSEKNEPADKHVQLPPAPADCGPWPAGPWQVRRATAYAPAARVVLTGPASDFDRLLTYLQAYPTPATQAAGDSLETT